MKKIGLFAGALFIAAIAFVGCKQEADEVENISTTSVVSEAKDAGITFNENAKAVESVEEFNTSVLPELTSALSGAVGNMDLTSLFSVETLKNLKANTSSFRAAITDADIEKAIADFEKQAEEFEKEMGANKNSYDGTIDWKAPEGEYTVVDGVVITINEGSVYLNVSGEVDSGSAEAKVKADAAADISSVINLQKAFNIKELPYARIAVKGDVGVSGKASGPESVDDPADLDIDISADAYVGYSGAYIFNLEKYAGVIKMDAKVEVDADINQALVKKYEDIFKKFDASSLNKTFFDELPIDASLKISVYSIDGDEMFTLIDAESLYDIYTSISSLVPTAL